MRESSGTSALVAATYDRHQRELFSFALRASRDSHAAEDLIEDAFGRLIEESRSEQLPVNVRAWLYRTVAEAVIAGGRPVAPTVGSVDPDLDHDPDLDRALGELAANERTALLLAAAGFSGIEIAEALGKSPSGMRTAMARSRLSLRRGLEMMGAGR